MLWRVILFAVVMAMSPVARASTELHGAGFWNAIGLGEPASDVRNDSTQPSLPKPYSTDLSSTEDAADAWAFAVDKALLRGGGVTTPAAKYDRFNWVFLLIAFAGLTALFAGRRTGGRGLISA